jgi:hypothetical protein
MSVADDVFGLVLYTLQRPGLPLDARLYEAIRLLCKYRVLKIGQSLEEGGGMRVRSGPFEGLQFPAVSEGSYVAKLLGSYEQELHPIIMQVPEQAYDAVINIGCAEGYYAVGLARMLPAMTIYAYDIDAAARQLCRTTAEVNGVAERVVIGEHFAASDFEAFSGKRCFVLCDIEGAELEILRPSEAPALADMDLLVEVHDELRPGCREEVTRRFEPTHDIQPLRFGTRQVDAFPELATLENLDQLLAFWEWRLAGNAWLWLPARR